MDRSCIRRRPGPVAGRDILSGAGPDSVRGAPLAGASAATRYRRRFLCSCLWLAAGTTPVEGAEADVLVVTSTAGEARETLTTPVAVHVVDGGRAEANRTPWIGESLNQLPGVYQAWFRGVIDVPIIRMPQTFKNHYLYLQDGVPLQSTVMFNSKALAYSMATTSPGGIEVLKGPGTALYGSDAMAAVIDVRSRAPQPESAAALRAGTGMFGGRSLRAEITGPLGGSQRAALAVGYDGEDGWRDHSGWERLQGLAQHRLMVGAATIDTMLMATRLRSEMTGQLAPAVFRNDPQDDGLASAVPLDEATDDADHVRLSIAIRAPVGGVSLEATPYLRFLDNTYLEVFNPATTPQDRERTASAGMLTRVRLWPWAGGEILAGVDAEWTRLDFSVFQSRPTTVVGGFTSYQGPHYDFTVDHLTVAPLLQVNQRLGDRWIVDGGVRWSWARYDYDDHLGPVSDPQDLVWRPPDRVDIFDHLSPNLGISLLLTSTQAVFARYAHGFRLPSADALYVLGNGQQAFALVPEQVDAYEIGWKGRIDRRTGWEIDAYWSDATDGIVEDVVTAGGTISTNGGRRWYRGVEIGGSWAFHEAVDVALAYAHTWHRIVRYRSDGDSIQDGQVPAKAPADLANLRLGFEPLANLRLEAELQWLGRWWMDDANTARTPDEWIVHLRGRWDITAAWAIDATVINLFDTAYASTAERFAYGDRYRPGQPLTASVGVSWGY